MIILTGLDAELDLGDEDQQEPRATPYLLGWQIMWVAPLLSYRAEAMSEGVRKEQTKM